MNERETHLQKAADLYLNGNRFMHRRDYRSALRCFKSALEQTRQSGQEERTIELLVTLGNIHAQMGEKETARTYYQEVLDLQRESPDAHAIGLTLVNLGNLCRESGALARSQAYYLEAEEFLLESGGKQALAMLYANLGLLSQDVGALVDAQGFLEKAIDLHKKTGYEEGLAAAWLHLGRIFLQLKKGHDAETCFNYSSSHFGALGDPGGQIEALRGLAEAYEHRKDPTLAIQCLERIKEINRRFQMQASPLDEEWLKRLQTI